MVSVRGWLLISCCPTPGPGPKEGAGRGTLLVMPPMMSSAKSTADPPGHGGGGVRKISGRRQNKPITGLASLPRTDGWGTEEGDWLSYLLPPPGGVSIGCSTVHSPLIFNFDRGRFGYLRAQGGWGACETGGKVGKFFLKKNEHPGDGRRGRLSNSSPTPPPSRLPYTRTL